MRTCLPLDIIYIYQIQATIEGYVEMKLLYTLYNIYTIIYIHVSIVLSICTITILLYNSSGERITILSESIPVVEYIYIVIVGSFI